MSVDTIDNSISARASKDASAQSSIQYAAKLVATVVDPELPFITIAELGVLRDVCSDDGTVIVKVSPTYSGCPAAETIEQEIERKLQRAGFEFRIERQLSPPWTTAWITPAGREKLRENGIAPPLPEADVSYSLFSKPAVRCPICTSNDTRRVSEFGSTACKAQYHCVGCQQPFEYFKCL